MQPTLQQSPQTLKTIDFFAQHNVLVLEALLSYLAILDVCIYPEPLDDVADSSHNGLARNRNHRYSPSKRRRRASLSPRSPEAIMDCHEQPDH